MSLEQAERIKQLGAVLKARREELGLSIRALEALSDVDNSTVTRLEQGVRIAPRPDVLAKLARALQLSLADLYVLAGYTIPQDLPNLTMYLRLKYRNMPEHAQAELTGYVQHLRQRYGLVDEGPTLGEDETE